MAHERKTILIEYACDGMGNNKVPISECIGSEKKAFLIPEEELLALEFINESTFIYNIDGLKKKLTPEIVSQIKEKSSTLKI